MAKQSQLLSVPDEEIGEVASLITRAFRGLCWHTEEEVNSDFTLTEEELRYQASTLELPGKLLQWKDDKGKRLGCVLVRPTKESDLIWRFAWLAIEPTLQTSGLGKTLMKYIEQYAQERGATTMEMNAINVRHNLIAWYKRRGYVPTGDIEPFVHNQDRHGGLIKEDLCFIVFRKQLS